MSYLPAASIARVNPGFFSITDFGAVADGVFNPSTGVWSGTDNGPAISNAIKAAIGYPVTFGNRFATVYFPPAAAGRAYYVSTPIDVGVSQSGVTSAGACHIRLLGNNEDSMLAFQVGNANTGMKLDFNGMEWFQGIMEGITFCPGDFKWASGHANGLNGIWLKCNVGKWIVRDCNATGFWAKSGVWRFTNGNFDIQNLKNNGCSSGNDGLGGGAFCYFDEPAAVRVSGLHSYNECNYLGFDNGATSGAALGLNNALILVNPSTDTGWGPTCIEMTEIFGNVRDGWLCYAYPTSGVFGCATLTCRNWVSKSSATGAFCLGYTKTAVIEQGSWAAGAEYFLLDGYSCDRIELRNIITMAGNNVPKIRVDSACLQLDIENCPGITNISHTPSATCIKRVSSKTQRSKSVGAALTFSTNTIAPVAEVHSVGAGLIKTITVPFTGFTGTVVLRPTAAFTYDATGNVLGTGTAVIGRDMWATYDGTAWAMSY